MFQARYSLTLPYVPDPDKAKRIDNAIASKQARRLVTGDHLLTIEKTAETEQDVVDIVQAVGRIVRDTLGTKLQGDLYVREVSDAKHYPILLEYQQALPLKDKVAYKLVFGATLNPERGATGQFSLYFRGQKTFDYSEPLKATQINEAQFEALWRGLHETLLEVGVDHALEIPLLVVSPAELVIKGLREGKTGLSQWSIRPDLVRWAGDVLRQAAAFKKVYWLLPNELTKINSTR